MESRFILGQQALTPDGAVYQIIWNEPYSEDFTPDEVALMLSDEAPENTIAGSTCIFNTEDADGYPVEWLFAYDGADWVLDRVVRGGSAGGGDSDFTTASVTLTNNSTTAFALAIPTFDAGGMKPNFYSDFIDGSAIPVVLYKGMATATVNNTNVKISATGDISTFRNQISILGDGSITFSD